jgi:hypothetical protein
MTADGDEPLPSVPPVIAAVDRDKGASRQPSGAVGQQRSYGADKRPNIKRLALAIMLVNRSPPWLVSMQIHLVTLIMLALFAIPTHVMNQGHEIVIEMVDDMDAADELDEQLVTEQLIRDIEVTSDSMQPLDVVTLHEFEPEVPPATPFNPEGLDAASQNEFGLFSEVVERSSDLLSEVSGGALNKDFGARSTAGRSVMVRHKGGTAGSEAAVELALRWLAAHQNTDGSWSYDHRLGGGVTCTCTRPGQSSGRYGSTALALLAFLGAGHSHVEGEYKKTVAGGIQYLVTNMTLDPEKHAGKMLDDGHAGMYAHGMATMALSEAYVMSYDERLRAPAQAAVNWIVQTQGPLWGYRGGGNDTSVSGWQIMALKSAYMARLLVPELTIQKISTGLDGLQSGEYGAFYGYNKPGKGTATTSVGLLARMYLGWDQTHPGLARGMQYIAQHGPNPDNMYFTYYATLAMFQYTSGEGPVWQQFNVSMRESLISAQHQTGHETGSWSIGTYLNQGGRLYSTAMCAMCLEVYYRYMPVYQLRGFADKDKSNE